MTDFFSHDVNARNDMKCAKLIKVLGYKGYGVFWSLIELMNEQSDCQLPADFEMLGWQLHINAKFLERVVREFDLFQFSEDGCFFWSASARKRLEAKRYATTLSSTKNQRTGKKRGRPRKISDQVPETVLGTVKTTPNFTETPETAQISTISPKLNNLSTDVEKVSQNAKETPCAQFQPNIQTGKIQFDDFDGYDDWTGETPLPEQAIEEWNKIFTGTPQFYRGTQLPADALHELLETEKSGYTIEDLRKAFQIAKSDDWCWRLKDVLKKDNVQLLLTKSVKQKKENGKNEYPEYMANKTYYDTEGKPIPSGLEFTSPEWWKDAREFGAFRS